MRISFKKILFVALQFSVFSVLAQSVNVTINGTTYNENNYTIPSFTELRRSVKSNDPTAIQNSIDNLKASDIPYNVVVNIYDDPKTKMAFNWFTNSGIIGGQVQVVKDDVYYTSAFTLPLITVYATSNHVSDLHYYSVSRNNLINEADIQPNTTKLYTENKAFVTGLEPNTTYYFRVGKAGAWSEIGTFTTAKNNKDAFTFIYLTDQQPYTYNMFMELQRVSDIATIKVPQASFWIHCGDMVESGTNNREYPSEWEWEQFFEKQQHIFYRLPFAPVLGNHNFSEEKNFSRHFHTNYPPFDNNIAVPGSTYSFVYGDALFFALNSIACYNYNNYNTPNETYANNLIAWMRAEVAKHPDVKWRIAYYHQPIFEATTYNNNDHDIIAWRNKMAPVFDELEIDVALEGHDHVYKVVGPVYNKAVVVGAVTNQTTVPSNTWSNTTGKLGGTFNTKTGTLYLLNNSAGDKKYWPLPFDRTMTEVKDYGSLFTGRHGQTGSSPGGLPSSSSIYGKNPTFSNVTVSTDTIFIATYEVFSNSTTTLYDEIKVVKPVPVITINIQPETITNVAQGNISANLTVSASVTLNATLSYQWYSNSTDSNTGGTAVIGATSSTFSIPVQLTAGTYYYFCELSATGGAIPIRSNIATVNVYLKPTIGFSQVGSAYADADCYDGENAEEAFYDFPVNFSTSSGDVKIDVSIVKKGMDGNESTSSPYMVNDIELSPQNTFRLSFSDYTDAGDDVYGEYKVTITKITDSITRTYQAEGDINAGQEMFIYQVLPQPETGPVYHVPNNF